MPNNGISGEGDKSDYEQNALRAQREFFADAQLHQIRLNLGDHFHEVVRHGISVSTLSHAAINEIHNTSLNLIEVVFERIAELEEFERTSDQERIEP
jgi:hypothetical protein